MVATDLPLVPHVDVGGRIDMSLKAPWHVVEAAFELNVARAEFAYAGHELNLLRDLVPCRIELVRGCVVAPAIYAYEEMRALD